MATNNPRWLDVVRHNIRGVRAPFLLVVQHHAVPAPTRLVAPVSPPVAGDVEVLAPRLLVNHTQLHVRLLDISAVRLSLLGETVASAADQSDAILDAMDIILRGYPVGLPN